MAEATILLIDDDATLLELLCDHLKTAGYRPIPAESGAKGLRWFDQEPPDLVILDVMMPGLDGWEICTRLRETSHVPIIMLTAKGQEVDKLRGFRLGVDDYVTKPFSFAELAARVGAVLARGERRPPIGQRIASGELSVDMENHRVTLGESQVDLTPTEYRLLVALARHPGRAMPTESLLSEVWGPEYSGETSHVKHYIWALRKKIERDPGDPQHILTERGFGYRFE